MHTVRNIFLEMNCTSILQSFPLAPGDERLDGIERRRNADKTLRDMMWQDNDKICSSSQIKMSAPDSHSLSFFMYDPIELEGQFL